VETQYHAEKNSPQHYAPASESEEQYAYDHKGQPVIIVEPTIIAVLCHVGSVTFSGGLIVILCSSKQYPTDVRPQSAVARRMWITLAICVGVMYAVRRNPLNGSTFERQASAGHKKVFNQLRAFVTAVSKQPVIAHTDTETPTNPVKDDSSDDRRPTPEKQSCDCSNMRNDQEDRIAPINVLPCPRR
jgi:hypothetical protein